MGSGRWEETRGPTGTHVERRAAAVILGNGVFGGKTKVCKLDIVSVIGHQNIFRLEVPVEDPQTVAMLHGIQELEERSADKSIIVHIPSPLGDIGEEISFRTVVQNNVSTLRVMHNLEHGHYVRMCRGFVMKLDFPGLEFPLSPIQRFSIGIGLAQGLDRVPCLGKVVDRRIYHTVRARAQYSRQFQRLSEEGTYP